MQDHLEFIGFGEGGLGDFASNFALGKGARCVLPRCTGTSTQVSSGLPITQELQPMRQVAQCAGFHGFAKIILVDYIASEATTSNR